MKANQLATLVLRLLGIYCLTQVIPAISISSSIAPIISSQDNLGITETTEVAVVILFLAFQIVIVILLIAKSVPWGEKLSPQDIGETNFTAVSFEQVQMFAFAVVGVLIFAGALPQLLNSISSIYISLHQITGKGQYSGVTSYNLRTLLICIGTILKAALGLWMFFGARGFANLWRSLKNFGTPKPPENKKTLNRESDSTI
jgi:hypothetical protein